MSLLLSFVSVALLTSSASAMNVPRSAALSACQTIANDASSAAAVLYPVDTQAFDVAIAHWMVSSTQVPTCVFEPATPADVSLALKVIAECEVPFAVEGGGHTSNPGFSSTTGVHISMTKFNQVVLSADKSTCEIGFGNLWNDVYLALNGTGVNVVGGRNPGIGCAGFIMGGGGYSYLSSQYGLTIDTVHAYNLVLPNGTITTVTSANSDLFFALKGGYNNYGIVTSVVLNTVPQPPVIYGGNRIYNGSVWPQVMTAIAEFAANSADPRVALLPAFINQNGSAFAQLTFFFDGPEADLPANSFQYFDGIATLEDTVMDSSFWGFFGAMPSEASTGTAAAGNRGTFNSLSHLTLTPGIIAQAVNQTSFYAAQETAKTGVIVSYTLEPFLSSYFDNSQGGAYPHSSSAPYIPLNVYFAWTSTSDDAYYHQAALDSVALLKATAIAEGQNIANAPIYPNYAIAGTPLSSMYGSNVARMTAIKKAVDPTNIMGLAGGFKIPV